MPLVETGIMKDIKLGSTDVQLVLQGSTVVWERDRNPEVGWPEDYYMPYVPGDRTNQMIMFFLPSTGSTSVHFGAYASDCEGEGGGPNLARLVDDDSILAHDSFTHTYSHPLTASTGNLWVSMYENYELYFGDPGNIFSEYNSKGMIVSGGYRGTTGDSCDSFFEITTAITEHYPDIEFFGIIGDVGNSDTVNGNPYAPSWTSDQQGSDWLTFTSLKWFFTEDTHWEIPLYMSTAFTDNSMKFTVKNSPNATFIVDDNEYWQNIIPWEMADYYNVVFKTRGGQVMVPDYSKICLTFEVLERGDTGVFKFSGRDYDVRKNRIIIQKNDESPMTYANAENNVEYRTMVYGDKMKVWGTDIIYDGSYIRIAGVKHKVYGNIASLFYQYGYSGCTSFPTYAGTPAEHQFEGLFYSVWFGSGELHSEDANLLVDASNLVLPFLSLTDNSACYFDMFSSCKELVYPPEILPATGLGRAVYERMFAYCDKLEKSPELPADVVLTDSYYDMFKECHSLNYVKCLATDITHSMSTYGWLYNVSPTGTFVKSPNMNSWTTGSNGIPSGWTVIDAT